MRPLVALGLAATAAAATLAPPAQAGGLLAPIWSGAYAGVDLGAGWSLLETGFTSGSLSVAGLTGGIHAGYNVQIGRLVAGIEGDAALTNASGTAYDASGQTLSADIDWTASVRARLGLAMGPLLFYGTGGVAWGEATYALKWNGTTLAESGRTSVGTVAGGGIEARILPSVSVRLEALHYMFGKESYTVSGSYGGRSFTTGSTLDTSFTTVRAGVSLGF